MFGSLIRDAESQNYVLQTDPAFFDLLLRMGEEQVERPGCAPDHGCSHIYGIRV